MAEFTLPAALQQAIQFHQAGHLTQAEALYREILARDPRCIDALHYLGVIAHQVGNHARAIASIRQALQLAPHQPDLHSNLGEAYRCIGQLDTAVACFQHALALQPGYHDAWSNLGNALTRQARFDAAIACYRRALRLEPNLARTHYNFGLPLTHQDRLDEAMACFQQAIALQPDFPDAYSSLAQIFLRRGQVEDALACYRRALAFGPDRADIRSNLILTLHYGSGHESAVIESELQRWNQRHAQPLASFTRPYRNDRSPDRRLRIGYVSPDFRSHAVGWFLRPLFRAHDRNSVELFCYSNAAQTDSITAELRQLTDGWREIAWRTDREVADLIREDRIDILVDLAVHTADNRLLVFAHKPAPVQVTYLGYPGPTGLAAIDYRLTDLHLDPPNQAAPPGPEQPFRLPETYWCYHPVVAPSPAVSPLPALTSGHVTFGCLNNFSKVTPAALAIWVRLLASLPEAKLVLHARPGDHRTLVRNLFAQNAIDPSRVRFVDRIPETQYLQTYQSIDIGLDPFPFPGGTTTCDALWMGVPVISLAGSTPLTRGGLTLLSNVGLRELVACSTDEYLEKAMSLARDLPRLVALRSGLRERMQRSPLMDAPRFARNVEAAYRTMWHRWCALPASVAVQAP